MRPLHILTALLLVALLAGCGTTQHFVPPMPIPPGTAAGTIGVSWSSSRFIPLGLQGNFYLGVAGGNMLGVGFNNFVLPSSFTYVHYERISDLSYANVQLHGTLLGIDPRYELDLGYAMRWGETTHAFKLGIGYLSTLQPGVEGFQRPGYFGLVPVAGYDARYGGVGLAAQFRPGTTAYIIGALLSGLDGRADTAIVIAKDSVVAIERADGWGSTSPWDIPSWKISLRDSTFLYVTPREDHFQEWLASSRLHELNVHCASPSYRFYRVVRTSVPYAPTDYIASPGPIMQLDMDAIVGRYERTGLLEIREEPGTLERGLGKASLLDDISVGIGVDVVR